MTRKPQLPVTRKPKKLDVSGGLRTGILRLIEMPEDIRRSLGIDPSVRFVGINKDFAIEHSAELTETYLSKLAQGKSLVKSNRSRKKRAAEDYNLYRSFAAEIVREHPHLAERRCASQLAGAVLKRLIGPPSKKTVLRALKK